MNETPDETQNTSTTRSSRQIDWSLLRPYARGLQAMGWAMVALFLFSSIGDFYILLFRPELVASSASLSLRLSASIVPNLRQTLFPGLCLLILAQLMRCLGDRELPPGLALRHGHWILCLYGVQLMYHLVVCLQTYAAPFRLVDIAFAMVVPCAGIEVAAAVVFGAALILRRLVSIIEESKTLV